MKGQTRVNFTIIEGNLRDALAIFVRDEIVLIEGNIEGHRGTTIFFIEGSLLECLIFEGHDCISEATSEVTLEVRV